jgi:hypothetical protein
MSKRCPKCDKAELQEVPESELAPFPFLHCPNCDYAEKECPTCGKVMYFSNSGINFPHSDTQKKWRYYFICMNFDCKEYNKLKEPVYIVK